ncbi:MAG: sulfurtransferase [Pirellulaceae bacterium]|jgi:thiosulfate/3-mercaptopyruvate sulfurtransferase|nr:sulfurtransferase [Thermoguttaceae bacterium]MDI9446721.1 sulfurtransferase [Planctomycetota bacterium]NLY98924.1 sulfurtransferase [Pirellulaceae bacterium]
MPNPRALLVIVAGLVGAANAGEVRYARPRLLMEPSQLAKPGVAGQFVILDARKQEAHAEEHLPNALWVDHDTWETAFDSGKDVGGWSKRIGQLGIGDGAKVVVYDDVSNRNAARIWWILRYFGLDDVRLLNGGWKAWKSAGLATSAEKVPPPEPVEFSASPRKKRLVVKAQVLSSLADQRLQIVDARSEDEHCGIDLKESARGGAIPGAKHIEWSDLIDPSTDRFKSPQELKRIFDRAGIDLDRPVASHCHSGGRASVMAFGLELMGAKDPRNYYRGWSEWGNRDDTPIVAPEKE